MIHQAERRYHLTECARCIRQTRMKVLPGRVRQMYLPDLNKGIT